MAANLAARHPTENWPEGSLSVKSSRPVTKVWLGRTGGVAKSRQEVLAERSTDLGPRATRRCDEDRQDWEAARTGIRRPSGRRGPRV